MAKSTAPKTSFTSARFKRYLTVFSKHAFLIFVALVSLAPIIWLITIAFRPVEETYVTPMQLLPRTFTLENTKIVIEKLPKLVLLYRNSFIITGATVFLVVLCTSLAWLRFCQN